MDFVLHYLGRKVIENAPFAIHRPEGSFRYIFFHFISPVLIRTEAGLTEASPGSCILYEPGVEQDFYVENNRLSHDYIDFTVEDKVFFDAIKFPLNTLINPRMSKNISESIEQIHEEANSPRDGNDYMVSSLICILFIALSRKVNNHSAGTNRIYQDELKGKFERLRLEMYHDPQNVSVKSMAKSLDFSRAHFNALYNKFFHVNPLDDLTKARIAYVKALFDEGEPTDVIVRKLGFSSNEYYFRWFKRWFGMTPTQYKTKLTED